MQPWSIYLLENILFLTLQKYKYKKNCRMNYSALLFLWLYSGRRTLNQGSLIENMGSQFGNRSRTNIWNSLYNRFIYVCMYCQGCGSGWILSGSNILEKKNTTGPNLQGNLDLIIRKHPESYLILHHKIHPVLFLSV